MRRMRLAYLLMALSDVISGDRLMGLREGGGSHENSIAELS